MKFTFRKTKLSPANKENLHLINSIINEYASDGYTLTLRQLYYQLVSRAVIPNKQNEYAKLSKLLKEGRMGGIVDWNAIEDRLRIPHIPYCNDDPKQAIDDAINQYRLDRQEGQDTYIEVWVEKDALSGVLKRVTSKYHIRLLVNRGYGSVTAIHDAYERLKREMYKGKKVKILYLGDHDPSGMDMIRDIQTRIMEMLITADGEEMLEAKFGENLFLNEDFSEWNTEAFDSDLYLDPEVRIKEEGEAEYHWRYDKAWIKDSFSVEPIALTMEQIKRFNPPKNPAKLTDPRAKWYVKEFGFNSWEVDALDPKTLNRLLSNSIEENIDLNLYNAVLEQEIQDKEKLKELATKL